MDKREKNSDYEMGKKFANIHFLKKCFKTIIIP